jgi:hypothetical protein
MLPRFFGKDVSCLPSGQTGLDQQAYNRSAYSARTPS